LTGEKHWTRERTLFNLHEKIPLAIVERFKVFIDKDSSGKNQKIYHIRVDVKIDGVLTRLNLRAKSALEMRTIVNTLKAVNRLTGEGGYFKHILADNFFSRGKSLRREGLVVNTKIYKITRVENSGTPSEVKHYYKTSTLDQFNIWPEFAGATFASDGSYLTTASGVKFDISLDDHAISTLDLMAINSNPEDVLGYILEVLGYKESNKYGSKKSGEIFHTAYGLIKDIQCLANILDGIAPIYMAQGKIYDYYKEAAQLPAPYIRKIRHIGIIAPLLSDNQYNILMDVLGFATSTDLRNINDPSQIPRFEYIIRDLSLHPEKYGFLPSEAPMLVKIQEALGLIVNPDHTVDGTVENPDYNDPQVISSTAGIQPDMQQWWENLRKSRQETSMMNKIYEYFLKLIDRTNKIDPAPDFRREYYGYVVHGT